MFKNAYSCALRAALIGLAMTGTAQIARSDVKDFEFRLVDQTIAVGSEALITVKLVNKATGKPVTDAVIFATRLDMEPDGMASMTTKIAPMPNTEPGTYRFKADVSMAGGWRLSLGAKVQGESGTIEGKLVLKATK